MSVSGTNIVKDVVSVDSKYGIHCMGTSIVEVRDNILYGSQNMKNSDCPLSSSGKCGCLSRTGVLNPTFGGAFTTAINDSKIPLFFFSPGGGWNSGL